MIALLLAVLFKWTFLFGAPPWVGILVLALPTMALAY